MSEVRAGHHDSPRGFVLVTVLWILAMLSALATAAAAYISTTVVGLRVSNEQLQIESLVEAALELTTYRRALDQSTSAVGAFEFNLAAARVAVEYAPESARIDLNAAPKGLLAGLFESLGADRDNASYYADRTIAWRSAPKESETFDEQSLYRKAGLEYGPRGAPFAHSAELWLVAGLPARLIEKALPFVTVYSGRSDVNAFSAPFQVLAAVPGIPRDHLEAFLKLRQMEHPDWQSALQALGRDQSIITTAASDAIHVAVTIELSTGRRSRGEVVILPAEKANYRVLSWSVNDLFRSSLTASAEIRPQ